MNVAVILAGGTGTRVGANIPKQFIEVDGRTILSYTIQLFQENNNIDAIEIVCHKDWIKFVTYLVQRENFDKVRWITNGGNTFQESVINGVFALKDDLGKNDIVIISFGVSPLTPQEDINDCIRVCKLHGNAISSKDIDLCTCIKENDDYTCTSIIRENLKGFANPWGFEYSELLESYQYAIKNNIIENLEPHTTSLYFKLGKKLWFSQCTSPSVKVTTKQDIDIFKGLMLLKK